MLGHGDIEAFGDAVLEGGWGADEGVLLEFGHLVDDRGGSRGVSESPTGASVGFAESSDEECVLERAFLTARGWAAFEGWILCCCSIE